jgi:hypothetical protein
MARIIFSIVFLWAIALLAGCGGGGGTDTTNAGSGTLGIFITDNPIADGTIKAVCVTYQQVEVLGDGRYTVYQGESRTFDLLKLRDHSRPMAFHTIPAGVYEKIRLTLENNGIELKLDDTDCHTPSRNSAYPHLPGNNKLDFVVKGGLVVAPDSKVFFEFDMDAEKAIHVVERSNGHCASNSANHSDSRDVDGACKQFNFRSVVFIRALTRAYRGKLIRLVGYIRAVDPEDRSLLLCDALPGMEEEDDNDDTRCIRVRVSPDDSFFDEEGFPQSLRALLLDDVVDKQATVNGKLWHVIKPDIPDGHRPPPGECRIWDPALPPGQQSRPGDCADLWELVEEGQFLIRHDEGEHRYPLVVDALTIGLGKTDVVKGETVSAPDEVTGSTDEEFTMDVDRLEDPLAVRLQAAVDDVNGTRIIDQRGNPLTSDALFPPRPVRVDGVYSRADVLMRGELVVLLDTDAMGLTGTTRLSGTIAIDSVAADGSGFVLMLDGSDLDNANAVPSLSAQSVTVPPDARILLVNTTDSSTQPLTREQLERAEGQYINLYAVKPADGLGDWIADTILVIISTPSP